MYCCTFAVGKANHSDSGLTLHYHLLSLLKVSHHLLSALEQSYLNKTNDLLKVKVTETNSTSIKVFDINGTPLFKV